MVLLAYSVICGIYWLNGLTYVLCVQLKVLSYHGSIVIWRVHCTGTAILAAKLIWVSVDPKKDS
ncbi:hypothetical protein EDD22DRAFT_917872 [Suillus occidentalis]|nr:hypothetical protein EDD22DRAFT_917872 [Suillus occidentalis]